MDKLTPVLRALDDILDDDRVSYDLDRARYNVVTDHGPIAVHQNAHGGWAAFHGSSSPENPSPAVGLAGSQGPSPQDAVFWALR